jgi:hypothetical protein
MAFGGQPVKPFDFYIHVNKMFVPSIKTFSKQAEDKGPIVMGKLKRTERRGRLQNREPPNSLFKHTIKVNFNCNTIFSIIFGAQKPNKKRGEIENPNE